MRSRFAAPLLLAVTLSVLAAEPTEVAVPPEKVAEAKAFIKQLDDDDMDVRDKASAGLEKLGRLAYPTMVETLKGKASNEVQVRLERLLPGARKADFDARYPHFLADQDGKHEHDLFGWNELKVAVGDTKESRKLFRDILADDGMRANLLLALATSADELKKFDHRWEDRSRTWRHNVPFNRPKVDDPFTFVAAGWLQDLVTGHERDENGGARRSVVDSFLKDTDEGKLVAAGKGAYGDVPLKLAKRWIDTRRGYFELDGAWALCRTLKLGEAEEVRQLERLADWSLEHQTGFAGEIGILAVTGDPKHVAILKRFFASDAVAYSQKLIPTLPDIQFRDMALAMSLVLTDQGPAEYGFGMQDRPKAELRFRANPTNYFFKADNDATADDKRAVAFKKWAAWEKANPDKLKAKPLEKKDDKK